MRRRVGVLAVCALAIPAIAVGQGVSIDHQGIGCVLAGKFPRFDARLDPAGDVARARVNFRPEGTPHWYWVEMKREAGLFQGILPKPQKTLHRFSYYIDVTDKAFHASRTAEFVLDVATGPAACGRQKLLAGSLGKANVLLHAPEGVAGAPAVPAGFSADGVMLAGGAGSTAGATAATAGGIGAKAVILGTVLAAGGAAAVVATTSGGDSADSPTTPPGTPPTPPPTTLPPASPPPAASLSGTWAGNHPGDGMLLIFSGCSVCPNTPATSGTDMLLNLTQSGSALSGDVFLTLREDSPGSCAAGSCSENPIGEVVPFSITGTVSGTSVTMQMTGGEPTGTITLNGTVTDNRMSGTLTGSDEGGRTITGTWAVNRQ